MFQFTTKLITLESLTNIRNVDLPDEGNYKSFCIVFSDVTISSSVREWLRSPAFDARQWEDEELLLMLQTMFVDLDLPEKFNIPLPILRNFLYEVYNNYNEVPFHNFRHCFCVAQMVSISFFYYLNSVILREETNGEIVVQSISSSLF